MVFPMRAEIFDRIEIFKDLPASVRRSVALQCRWAEYQPGESIMERGTPDDALLILARGRAQVFASTHGEPEATVRYVQQGEVFGEIAPIDGGPRWATAVACEPCVVAAFPSDLLWDLMKARPKIMAVLLKRLATTVREISPSIIALLSHSG
jgi:CRP-like cAMP-binding protein